MFVHPYLPGPDFLSLTLPFHLLFIIHLLLYSCVTCYNYYVFNISGNSGHKLCDFAEWCLRVSSNLNYSKRERRKTHEQSSHPVSGLGTNHHGHSCVLAQGSLVSHCGDWPLHHLLVPAKGLQWLRPWLECGPQPRIAPVEQALKA